jgi:GPI-anchor transamidase subunit T
MHRTLAAAAAALAALALALPGVAESVDTAGLFSEDLALSPALPAPLAGAEMASQSHSSLDALAMWRFRTTSGARGAVGSVSHYGLFPRAVARLFESGKLAEASISFTQGRLNAGEPALLAQVDRSEEGSYSSVPASTPALAPVGAEVWARFSEEGREGKQGGALPEKGPQEEAWSAFVGAAGGLFCGSLQQLADEGKFARPALMSLGLGRSSGSNGTAGELFYASLPREAACTENLTPYLSLLPASRTGLAALLDAERLFDGRYVSMRTHMWREEGTGNRLVLEQSLTAVLSYFPAGVVAESPGFSLEDVLGAPKMVHASPFAARSTVRVLGTPEVSKSGLRKGAFEPLQPELGDAVVAVAGSETAWWLYDLALRGGGTGGGGIPAKRLVVDRANLRPATPSAVSVSRYLTGIGLASGGVATHVTNDGPTTKRVLYAEVVPSFMRVYLHSLSLELKREEDSVPRPVSVLRGDAALGVTRLVPAEIGGRAGEIELEMWLPAHSRLSMTYDFDKAFLHFTKFPPDAHRGYDVGSAIVFAADAEGSSSGGDSSSFSEVAYSLGLLVDLPTPDFSMPYNVITITGTMFALFFGSMLNLMLRRMKRLRLHRGDFVSNRPLARLVRTLVAVLADEEEEEDGEQGNEKRAKSG